MFEIELGPDTDKRYLKLDLPTTPKKLGVMVSGGLDSAILYYIIQKLNIDYKLNHDVTPIIILREEGSKTHAYPVVEYVNNLLNLPNQLIEKFDFKQKIPPHIEIKIGVSLLKTRKKVDHIFIGLIVTRPEHAIGIDVTGPVDDEFVLFPFALLEKCHIVDLINKLNVPELFNITISCDKGVNCGKCNGCRERKWGLTVMNMSTPF
jgi:hypothetical protein